MCENRVSRIWVAIYLTLALGAVPLAVNTVHGATAHAKQVIGADSGWPEQGPNRAGSISSA